jgi:hypothetical protein
MSDHHPNSPSSIFRRLLCPYSGKIEPTLPESTNPAAEEGTMLHDRMEVGNFAGLTDEQFKACVWAQDAVDNILLEHGEPVAIHKELKMNLLNNDGETITFGTADLVFVYDDFVVVADYKFGFGYVGARGNKQLLVYSLMAMQMFDVDMAHAYIIQPRIDNFGHDTFDYSATTVDYINDALIQCEMATPVVAKPHAKACQYCKARQICPALKKSETDLMKFDPVNITVMSYNEVSEMLDKVDHVRTLLDDMEKQAERRFTDVGDLTGLFEQKQTYKQGAVAFSELQDHVTIDAVLVKGFNMTQGEFQTAYVNKHKQGVRGEVAGLRETAKGIYQGIKKGKAKPDRIKIVRCK